MRPWPKHAGIGLLFLLSTWVMTYPLGLAPGSAISDAEDGLLNTWILAWDVEQIRKGNVGHFFDANIFYPHSKVLAYSEHLFSLSLFSLPVKVLSGNPILAYNVVLLLSFFLCGFGQYLLAFHFTKNHWASFLGGIIFSFAPYRFAQLTHLQVLWAWAIPLTFLTFHKLLLEKKDRYLIGMIVCFLLQALGNGYFALYLTLFLGMAFLYFIWMEKRYKDRGLLLRLVLFSITVAAAAFPFFYPYLAVRKEMHFLRSDLIWADISSYLASGPLNRIYGSLTAPFLRPEGELFPGLTALFLGYLGLKRAKKDVKGVEKIPPPSLWIQRGNRLYFTLILAFLSLAATVVVTGGWAGKVGGFSVSARTPRGFISAILLLMLIRLGYDRAFRAKLKRFFRGPEDPALRFYYGMGVGAFFFTLGPEIHLFGWEILPWGPYDLLRRWVPGFDGLRVSSRFFVFFLMCLSLFASLGFAAFERRCRTFRRKPLLTGLSLFIFLEYCSAPLPLTPIPVGTEIPAVYSWLKEQADDGAVVELPLPKPWIAMARTEAPRLYFSIYHGKRLFNGYSGYFPPVYMEMLSRMSQGTAEERWKEFRMLGIRYVIVHGDQGDPPETARLMDAAQGSPLLVWKVSFGPDHVFEIPPVSGTQGTAPQRREGQRVVKARQVKTVVHVEAAHHLQDGKEDTYWGTGRPQTRGDFILFDLGKEVPIDGLILHGGERWQHYPRGLGVEGSRDGVSWFTIHKEDPYHPPITAFLTPTHFRCPVNFPPHTVRWLRLTNLRSDPQEWAAAEIEILAPAASNKTEDLRKR